MRLRFSKPKEVVYRFEEPTAEQATSQPTLVDPFERRNVWVWYFKVPVWCNSTDMGSNQAAVWGVRKILAAPSVADIRALFGNKWWKKYHMEHSVFSSTVTNLTSSFELLPSVEYLCMKEIYRFQFLNEWIRYEVLNTFISLLTLRRPKHSFINKFWESLF